LSSCYSSNTSGCYDKEEIKEPFETWKARYEDELKDKEAGKGA